MHISDKMLPLRLFLSIVLPLFFVAPAAAQKPDLTPLETTLTRIVNKARGKVGVGLIHLESGATLHVRGHERFPMASVVKLPIAIEVLTQVAGRKLRLDRDVPLNASDIRPCCSIERRHPNGGISRTVGELLELAIIESDNTAADALLKLVGGPDAVERRMRALGFNTINVNRSEGQLLLDMAGVVDAPPPEQWTVDLQRRLVSEVDRPALNKGRVLYLADERDTATPYETAQLLGRLQLGDLLPASETELLVNLMIGTTTGGRRIKGRIPADTVVAHKTGTTAVVINDVGIITLPADSRIGGRIAIAVYVADGSSIAAMERSVAQISAASFEFFSGREVPRTQSPQRRQRAQRKAK
jgi:beta-lactamase class A